MTREAAEPIRLDYLIRGRAAHHPDKRLTG